MSSCELIPFIKWNLIEPISSPYNQTSITSYLGEKGLAPKGLMRCSEKLKLHFGNRLNTRKRVLGGLKNLFYLN